MIDNISLMHRAKAQLADNWMNAAIGTLIYLVIMGAASCTYIGELVLFGSLSFGYFLFIGCLVDTKAMNLNLLFKGFDRFVETLIAGLLYSVAVSIGTALLIVPGIIIGLGFSMTFFIMADDPNISGIDALKMSWNLMNGWMILAIITCGIGYLWLAPYMTATTLNFYRQLRYGTC